MLPLFVIMTRESKWFSMSPHNSFNCGWHRWICRLNVCSTEIFQHLDGFVGFRKLIGQKRFFSENTFGFLHIFIHKFEIHSELTFVNFYDDAWGFWKIIGKKYSFFTLPFVFKDKHYKFLLPMVLMSHFACAHYPSIRLVHTVLTSCWMPFTPVPFLVIVNW